MRKEVSRTKNAESRDTSRKEQKSAKSTSGVGYSSYITTQPIQPIQFAKKNETGLPDKLKAGVENLSGYRMDDVKVHYNSDKPAKVNAYAYTQGTDIHVAPGQERHLPHEAWHVVQQKEGRVKPTLQLKGIQVNDDKGLEHEADVMGAKATNATAAMNGQVNMVKKEQYGAIQCMRENVFDIAQINRGGRRPDSPDGGMWSLNIKNVPPGGLKRDHIIPWATIRNYTFVISQIRQEGNRKRSSKWITTAIDSSYSALKQGKYSRSGLVGNRQEEINDAKRMSTERQVDQGVISVAKGIIRDAVSWMPGNIVIAPANRANDLAAGFDYELLKICEDYDYLIAYNLMEEMIQNRKDELNDFKKIDKVNKILKKIAKKTKPFLYNHNKWIKNEEGKYIAK